MHVRMDVRRLEPGPQLRRIAWKHGRLPVLRVAQEELHGIRGHGPRVCERISLVQMCADASHPGSVAPAACGPPAGSVPLAEAAVPDPQAHADEAGDDASDQQDALLPGCRVKLAHQADAE